MTPLRQRMTEDMQLAGYSSKTQQAYVGAVRQLFAHFNCSPAQLTEEQLQNMQMALLKAIRYRPNLDEAIAMLSEVDSLLGQR